MAAFHMSQVSPGLLSVYLPAPLNPVLWPPVWRVASQRWISPFRDQWRITQQRDPTYRGLNLTQQTKLSSFTLTVCPRRALRISDLSCLWQRVQSVDRWWSSSPSSANYFCPGPTVSAKEPFMLSVTLSPLYHFSFLCVFIISIHLCPSSVSVSGRDRPR